MQLNGYTATTGRVLRQLRADHRSMAMILLVPSLLIALLYYLYRDTPTVPFRPSPFNIACLFVLV